MELLVEFFYRTLISQKRRGHWTLKEFEVICLNQPLCGGLRAQLPGSGTTPVVHLKR